MRSTAGDRVRLGFHLFFFAFSCAVPELIFVVSGERKGLASVGGDVRRGLLGPAVNLFYSVKKLHMERQKLLMA